MTKRISLDLTPDGEVKLSELESLLTSTGHAAACRYAIDLALDILKGHMAGDEFIRRKPSGQESTFHFLGVKSPTNV